ncbi:hypothetical protein QMO56_23400 [Roseomonas sp. E05]|uniref:hypothetical protein n=1 Tax=Roseomonas sp. E05 TaxID=3046310 RepID=UPI0024B89987|nr:hypothetical protein [Roseomonas sp. E05]MDJ0391061.1 hypothetical protein [Roseomonas sp. E05]
MDWPFRKEAVKGALRLKAYLDRLSSITRSILNLPAVLDLESKTTSKTLFQDWLYSVAIIILTDKTSQALRSIDVSDAGSPTKVLFRIWIFVVIVSAIFYYTNKIFPNRPINFRTWFNASFAIALSAFMGMVAVVLLPLHIMIWINYLPQPFSPFFEKYYMTAVVLFGLAIPAVALLANEQRLLKLSLREWIVNKLVMGYVMVAALMGIYFAFEALTPQVSARLNSWAKTLDDFLF